MSEESLSHLDEFYQLIAPSREEGKDRYSQHCDYVYLTLTCFQHKSVSRHRTEHIS